MILISHRGNLNGPSQNENTPLYIDDAIKQGFDVEIDIWVGEKTLYLGHDEPLYEITHRWLRDRISKLWIHCKHPVNSGFLDYLNSYDSNYFWHQDDDRVLTSHKHIWTYPGRTLTSNSIAVLPENVPNWDISNAAGVCSDYIVKYRTNH